jgi:hypothetical protein
VQNPVVAKKLNLKVGDTFRPSPKQRMQFASLYLENAGLRSEPWSQELINALHSDIKKGLPLRVYEQVAEKYSKTSMFFFSFTEGLNRLAASKIGGRLAKDILADDAIARAWVGRIASPGVKNQIIQLATTGKGPELERVVQQYLISKSILNYTRQSMSNFGRFMGPMFSMFTKWPSTVAGEIVEQYVTNGMKKGSLEVGARYVLPWVTLAGLAAALQYWAEQQGQEERIRGITGSKGVEGWAPILATEALLGGEFLKSPAADIWTSLGKVLTNPTDVNALVSAMDDAAMTFLPGMAIGRMWLEDKARIIDNEEPEYRMEPFKLLIEEGLGIELPKKEK